MNINQTTRCSQVASNVDRSSAGIELNAPARGRDGAIQRGAARAGIVGVGDGAGSPQGHLTRSGRDRLVHRQHLVGASGFQGDVACTQVLYACAVGGQRDVARRRGEADIAVG